VAGLTEGFVTPWDLPTVPAVGVGLLLSGAFWTMVVRRGGPEVARPPAVAPPMRPVLTGGQPT